MISNEYKELFLPLTKHELEIIHDILIEYILRVNIGAEKSIFRHSELRKLNSKIGTCLWSIGRDGDES